MTELLLSLVSNVPKFSRKNNYLFSLITRFDVIFFLLKHRAFCSSWRRRTSEDMVKKWNAQIYLVPKQYVCNVLIYVHSLLGLIIKYAYFRLHFDVNYIYWTSKNDILQVHQCTRFLGVPILTKFFTPMADSLLSNHWQPMLNQTLYVVLKYHNKLIIKPCSRYVFAIVIIMLNVFSGKAMMVLYWRLIGIQWTI